MRLVLLAFSIFAFGIGCRQAETSDLTADKPEEVTVVGDCFTNLFADKIENSKIASLSFVNGTCIGKYSAINKRSEQRYVYVTGGQGFELPSLTNRGILKLTGNDIVVEVDGRRLPVGHLGSGSDNMVIKLNDGVTYTLAVRDQGGVYDEWHYGDKMFYQDEVLWLSIPGF